MTITKQPRRMAAELAIQNEDDPERALVAAWLATTSTRPSMTSRVSLRC